MCPSWQPDVSYVDEGNVCTLGAPVSNGADGTNGTGGIVDICGAHLPTEAFCLQHRSHQKNVHYVQVSPSVGPLYLGDHKWVHNV